MGFILGYRLGNMENTGKGMEALAQSCQETECFGSPWVFYAFIGIMVAMVLVFLGAIAWTGIDEWRTNRRLDRLRKACGPPGVAPFKR